MMHNYPGSPMAIKSMTLRQLRESRAAMLHLDFLMALDILPLAEQKEAAWQLSRVQLAYHRLRNARLSEIRDQLKENAAALTAGCEELHKKLADLRNVQKIMAGVAAFLKIIGRVIDKVI